MARRAAYKKRKKNKLGAALIVAFFILIGIVVGYRCYVMNQRIEDLKAQQAEYERLIEEEKLRTEDIEKYEEYTMSKAYIEDHAKDFGLVHENQILLKPEKK